MQKSEWTMALHEALSALETVVRSETDAVASGRIREALDLLAAKTEAFTRYREALAAWQAHAADIPALPPAVIATLRARHEAMARALQHNQAVLMTTRSVAEDLIREVSQRMSRPQPAAYGPAGQSRSAPSHAPIALSRTS